MERRAQERIEEDSLLAALAPARGAVLAPDLTSLAAAQATNLTPDQAAALGALAAKRVVEAKKEPPHV